jgi:dCMP deaminase
LIERLGWDEYFLEVATAISLRGDCTRSKVGAVLVDDNHRIIATGYNGVPPGVAGCLSGACPRGKLSYEELPPGNDYSNCIANHAEFNAILYASPEERSGTTLYITRRPCDGCKQLALAEHVTRVVWLTQQNEIASERMFE